MSECRDLHVGTAVRPFASPTSSVQWTERHCRWVPVCAAAAEVLLGGRSWAGKGSQREVRRPVTRNSVSSACQRCRRALSPPAAPLSCIPGSARRMPSQHHRRGSLCPPQSCAWVFTGPEERHLRETSDMSAPGMDPGAMSVSPDRSTTGSFPSPPTLRCWKRMLEQLQAGSQPRTLRALVVSCSIGLLVPLFYFFFHFRTLYDP